MIISLLLMWGALYLPGLGRSIINRAQELRVALTSRYMAEGGSWLVPQYLGEPRLRKPPLMYWITATSYKMAGTTHSLTAARLPSTLAAAVLALVTYVFGASIMGRRRAWLAAMIALSSFIALRQGRSHETDVTLTLLTSCAACCGYLALKGKNTLRWWLCAGISAGFGFMIKGPAALILPLLAWIAFSLTKPRRWTHLVSTAAIPGVVAFLLIVLPWYIAITFLSGLDAAAHQQMESEVSRMLTEKHHEGPIYYYVYTILHAMAPWSLLIPVALVASRRVWHHSGLRFSLMWFATTFVTLSLLSTKQIHYATLLTCPAALLMGWFLGFSFSRAKSWKSKFADRYVTVLLIAFVGLGAALVFHLGIPPTWPTIPCRTYGCVIALLAFVGLWTFRNGTMVRVFMLTLAFAAATAFQAKVVEEVEETCAAVPDFFHMADSQLPTARSVYVVGSKEAVLEYYANCKLVVMDTVSNAWATAQPGSAVIVVGNKDVEAPDRLDNTAPVVEAKRKDMVIRLFLKPAPTSL